MAILLYNTECINHINFILLMYVRYMKCGLMSGINVLKFVMYQAVIDFGPNAHNTNMHPDTYH